MKRASLLDILRHGISEIRIACRKTASVLESRSGRGRQAEQLAVAFLKRQGYAIEATNVRFRAGELDIVAQEDQTLCLVEVRSSASPQFGPAIASITERKRQRLLRAARRYLHGRRPRWEGDVRFDVVAIQYAPDGTPSLELVRGAFHS